MKRLSRWHHPLRKRRVGLLVEELECRDLPSVMTPAQIRHAYGFDRTAFSSNNSPVAADGAGQTIAIVTAFDDPNIVSDLKTFDQTFKLNDPVLVKTSPSGTTPKVDAGWALETSLDVQWSHAIAPGAKILLVEATSDSLPDLMSAVDYARHQTDVSVISMSWGIPEAYLNPTVQAAYDQYFTTPTGHQGITFVAASGDSGAWPGPEWPAISSNVLSVGGTSLQVSSPAGIYARETAWSGSGGGISSVESEPAYQQSVQHTGRRTGPDVAYDASPSSGFYVYDSLGSGSGGGGWYAVAGTSAGAPQWAGLIAVANQGRSLSGLVSLNGAQAALYQLPKSDFHDVTSGSNGYRAATGYDLTTGLGSPVANLVIADLVQFGATTQTASATSTSTNSTTKPASSSSNSSSKTTMGVTVTPVAVVTSSATDLTAIATALLLMRQAATTPTVIPAPTIQAAPPVLRSDLQSVPAPTASNSATRSVESGGGGLEQYPAPGDDGMLPSGTPNPSEGTPADKAPAPAAPSKASDPDDDFDSIPASASNLYFAVSIRTEAQEQPLGASFLDSGDQSKTAAVVALLGGFFISLGERRKRQSRAMEQLGRFPFSPGK